MKKLYKLLHRTITILIACTMVLSLSCISLAIERDSLGANHSDNSIGIQFITNKIRKGTPNYYGAKTIKKADSPEIPAPKIQTPITRSELAKKYNITILDRSGYLSGPYAQEAIAIIDAGLGVYSTEFVRALVERYSENGVFFAINLHYPTLDDAFKGATEVDPKTICINLVVPLNENPGGISVGTVAHEFGHAIFHCIELDMGKENLAHQWSNFNGLYEYGNNNQNRGKVFMSDYGAKYYYEDSATILEAFADAPEMVIAKLSNKDYIQLLEKSKFLEQCIEKHIGIPGTIFSNVWNELPQK